MAGRDGRRLRLEDLRRKHRRRHVLHFGHDGRSQRRSLQPSFERAARHDRRHARRHGHLVARHHPAGGADVPCQCLGPWPERADDRRQAGDARRQDGRRLDLRTAGYREGDLQRRRADRLDDAAAISGGDRQETSPSEEGRHRRLRLPARHHQKIPGQLRCPGHPRLGHDRDVAARHAGHHEAGIRRAEGRGAARLSRASRAIRPSASR